MLSKEQIFNMRTSVKSIWIITTTETLKLFKEPNSKDNSYFEWQEESTDVPWSVLGNVRQLTNGLCPVTSLYTTGHGVDSLNQYKFILL